MIKVRRTCIGAVVAVLILSYSAFAQQGPTKVETVNSELRDLPVSLTLVGSVEPSVRSLLAAEVSQRVKQMPARQGDLIESGGLICKLDDATLSLAVQRDEARLAQLQAKLEELVNGTRPETLAQQKAEYESALAIANKWEFELQRVTKLHDIDRANAKEYHDTVGDHASAQMQAEAAKAAYDLGVAGPRKEEIAQARYQVAEQEAVIASEKIDLAKTEVRAPFGGFVVERHTEVGEWVQAGGPVVELVDLSTVLVRIDVPEKAIDHVHEGDRAEVLVDALGEVFEGKIKHVIPQANETARTFPVEIEVANPDYKLKSGMFCRATIVAGDPSKIVAVPKDAVSRNMGATFIAIVGPGPGGQLMASPMPVTVGLEIDDWVAITSGNVPPGAPVVTRGNEMIVLMMSPTPVEIVGGNGPAQAPAKAPEANSEAAPAPQQ